MKNKVALLPFVILSILLSGCVLEPDVAEKYKQAHPLVADIFLPETFQPMELSTFEVVLTQDGKQIDDADFVHFEIWKQDGTVNFGMEEAEETADGTYAITKTLESNGLYYIKVHASNNGSLIMPRKQFVVGELSESELDFLKSGAQLENTGVESHH
ncbi:FixH family protein [Radiobacillus sp. PE A8.2]|uniref:FixH family protein n=1 Tax=Radiobacillus sp. PE A8.2 TaxID=3380349 RepID=UPI00388F2578